MLHFAFTFGQVYRRAPHPKLNARYCHPDGYLVIESPDEFAARTWFVDHFTNAWCGTYELWTFDPTDYPRGELARFTVAQPPEVQVPDVYRDEAAEVEPSPW